MSPAAVPASISPKLSYAEICPLDRMSPVADKGARRASFGQIARDLEPEEARILQLLHACGPQPVIDMRTRGEDATGLGVAAPGLTVIGREAGCLHTARVPAYLENLCRLGLVRPSRGQLRGERYQLLESEAPPVHPGGGQARRCRIQLTGFGREFCEAALAPVGRVPAVLGATA